MKRKKRLESKKGLKRGDGLKRSGDLKRTPLNPVSRKRQSEQAAREQVRRLVMVRDQYTCQAKHIQDGPPCWGPLEVDEIVSRARRPGGHLDVDNCQVLCRGHNQYKEDDPAWALRHGLARNSWD
jgi:5-methylcytosine-specific restriction endonuclease McrA